MQQDSNALFSQSLGASSNFYFSDHDLCLLVTWSPCQVYGLLLSNQSEPPNVHKNWIPSQGKTKYKTSVSLSCILDFEIFFVCDVYRTFVPIKFSYISLYKHTVVKISTSNRAFWSFGRRETQRMAISIILSQPCCTQIILCGLRMIPFVQCFSNHLVKRNTVWIGYVDKIPCISSYFASMAGMCFWLLIKY